MTAGGTGCGKSYTLQGTPKDGGIIPKTLNYLFHRVPTIRFSSVEYQQKKLVDLATSTVVRSAAEAIKAVQRAMTMRLTYGTERNAMSSRSWVEYRFLVSLPSPGFERLKAW